MGKISVSFSNGMATLWVTEEIALRMDSPLLKWENDGRTVTITNKGRARTWDRNIEGNPRLQIKQNCQKGRLPTKDFGRTDVLECRQTVPGSITMVLPEPAQRKKPIYRSVNIEANKIKKLEEQVKQLTSVEEAPAPRETVTLPTMNAPLSTFENMTPTQRFRAAVEIVNETKKQFGNDLQLMLTEEGTLKASLLVEFG